MEEYAVGFDFGSLSVRGLLVNVQTGEELCAAVYNYPHGIMSEALPDGTAIPQTFALQHPLDYLMGIAFCSKKLLRETGIAPEQIIGIGIDSTASTIMPVDDAGVPLCLKTEFRSNPQAWLKLWKHHGGNDQAKRLSEQAARENTDWFRKYGGVISSEWFLPKAIELAETAPEVYQASSAIVEIGDWLAWVLTGKHIRSQPLAACNSCCRWNTGYPDSAFFRRVSAAATDLVEQKLSEPHKDLGEQIGMLTEDAAFCMGLKPDTPLAVPIVDSHASVCASGAQRAGDLVYICGTSAVEIMLTDKETAIPGIHINARNASIPGLFSLGAGQNSVGDLFSWFVDKMLPENFSKQLNGKNPFEKLNEKAVAIGQGKSGLLTLDWWNGVRTPYFRFDLGGAILGLNIKTKPEQIWLSFLEAHAMNVRRCLRMFLDEGHAINRIYATGGIANKNPLLMQILSDVLQMEINVVKSHQTAALGSAIFGAAASEKYTFTDLAERMHSKVTQTYTPNKENAELYDRLFSAYCRLADEHQLGMELLTELADK